jgi:hypothetical protein
LAFRVCTAPICCATSARAEAEPLATCRAAPLALLDGGRTHRLEFTEVSLQRHKALRITLHMLPQQPRCCREHLADHRQRHFALLGALVLVTACGRILARVAAPSCYRSLTLLGPSLAETRLPQRLLLLEVLFEVEVQLTSALQRKAQLTMSAGAARTSQAAARRKLALCCSMSQRTWRSQ